MKTKAIVFPAQNEIEVWELELPEVGDEMIRTETLYSFVSPGTELRTLQGHYSADKHYPIIPGYARIERVVEIGKAVKGYQVGDILSSRAGCEFKGVKNHWGGEVGGCVYVPGNQVILATEAKENPLKYAPCEVAAISYRGVVSAKAQKDDSALVVGLGMIGRFVAEFLRMAGCAVTVCDIDKERLAEACESGFSTVLLDDDAAERVAAHGMLGFDIVAECSGTTPGFQLAVKMIRRPPNPEPMNASRQHWPRLLLQGNYVEDIPLNPCWFFKGEGIILLTPADRLLDDRQKVADLIRRGKLDTAPYTKNVYPVDEMPDAYRKLQNREISSLIGKWF
jgi:2-desacetyl-2-hydroxyethyl bacteriochlorophyllide A dehydrogenase